MNYQSRLSQAVYFSTPAAVKNLLSSVYGFQQRRRRYGREFEEALAFLRESQFWPNERLRDHQKEQRDRFLETVLKITPFYRSRPHYGKEFGNGTFENLPVLSKADVREFSRELIPDNLDSIPHTWKHTSGTTGTSLNFPISVRAFQQEYALRSLHNSWGGVSLEGRDRIAFCAGHPVAAADRHRPPFWAHDWANNMVFFSSYHLKASNMEAYVRELERFQPVMISGYPSSIYLLAIAYAKHRRTNLPLRSIFTSSETLFPFQRERIEQIFEAKVFNYYGNTELCANVLECEKGELHLKPEYSYVEILDRDGHPCTNGQTGRLVCTNYGNTAFPLVRYDIGDVVTVSENQESRCGRSGILLDRILGRIEDYVVTPDGRLVGRLDHIFKDSARVVEAQIVQNSVDEVILRIVPSPEFTTADEKELLRLARLRLGSVIRISFEYVDSMPRTASGKFRFILSSIDQQTLLQNWSEQ